MLDNIPKKKRKSKRLLACAVIGIIIAVTQEPWDPTQLTPPQLTILIVLNVIIYLSTVLSYFAWVMPERISNWLIKES